MIIARKFILVKSGFMKYSRFFQDFCGHTAKPRRKTSCIADRLHFSRFGPGGGSRIGRVFRPDVFGVTPPHFLADIFPRSAPESGQIASDLDRTPRRRKQFQQKGPLAACQHGMYFLTVHFLYFHCQNRYFPAVINPQTGPRRRKKTLRIFRIQFLRKRCNFREV